MKFPARLPLPGSNRTLKNPCSIGGKIYLTYEGPTNQFRWTNPKLKESFDKIQAALSRHSVSLDVMVYCHSDPLTDSENLRIDAEKNGIVNFVAGDSQGRVVVQRSDTGGEGAVGYRLYVGGLNITPAQFLSKSPKDQAKLLGV